MYGQQNQYSQPPYTGYGYQQYGQRNYMQQQFQQQPAQQIMPTLCYAKIEEAKPYIITAPNSSMLFIDREKGKALLKYTDNMCNSYPRYFNITETDENGNILQEKPQEQVQKLDTAKFISKDEIDNYGFVRQNQLNALIDKMQFMQDRINSIIKPKSNEKEKVE